MLIMKNFSLYILFSLCAITYGHASELRKKALFLGDSFTVGTGLEKGFEQDAFPYQLTQELRESGIKVESPKLYAVNGHTTKHLLGALDNAEPHSNPDNPGKVDPYDLVILSIGINDLFRGHNLEDYKQHFSELLERAIKFARDNPAKVLVVSIPAWDASPSVANKTGTTLRESKYMSVDINTKTISVPIDKITINKEGKVLIEKNPKEITKEIEEAKTYNTKEGIAKKIDEFNKAAKTIAERHNVGFINITAITRKEAHPKMFTKDGIHYSKEMYKKWVEHVAPQAKKILKREL